MIITIGDISMEDSFSNSVLLKNLQEIEAAYEKKRCKSYPEHEAKTENRSTLKPACSGVVGGSSCTRNVNTRLRNKTNLLNCIVNNSESAQNSRENAENKCTSPGYLIKLSDNQWSHTLSNKSISHLMTVEDAETVIDDAIIKFRSDSTKKKLYMEPDFSFLKNNYSPRDTKSKNDILEQTERITNVHGKNISINTNPLSSPDNCHLGSVDNKSTHKSKLVSRSDNNRSLSKNQSCAEYISDNSRRTSYETNSFLAPEAKLELSSWGLPEFVLRVECLSLPGVLDGRNLVYSAPTSAGKTLVSEIILLKRVLENGKKGIFILPFVSVTREKTFSLQKIFGAVGIRVEGFMGGQAPPGGLQRTDIAICTIEKANNLINRLIEEKKVSELGILVVDELHMVGDSHRGYLLELLLTKLLYLSEVNKDNRVQIIGMSATLPNLNVLASWLKAELYCTSFRPVPLVEMVKLDKTLYSNQFTYVRELDPLLDVNTDKDHLIHLCLETVLEGYSVLIFCPTKSWCEKIALSVASGFFSIGKPNSSYPQEIVDGIRKRLDGNSLSRVIEALRNCPAGLDTVLAKSLAFGAAFHHAGLTFDERDIIEGAFRAGYLPVVIATSTLSSGVNLPARRVIIRSPNSGGKLLDALTYKQMIGRAGRKGRDTQGESILMCSQDDRFKAQMLVTAELPPVTSCLFANSSLTASMKRAILEVVVSGSAKTADDIKQYWRCTLLSAAAEKRECGDATHDDNVDDSQIMAIDECMKYLLDNELVRCENRDGKQMFIPSQLGTAILASGLSADEGLHVFSELQRARKCFVLENELHIVYQVTPVYVSASWPNIDWMTYLEIWESLPPDIQKVGELVGVQESFIVRSMNGTVNLKVAKQRQSQAIHQRFFAALALHDLIHEASLSTVVSKYGATKGLLQGLQQQASTFSGMVTIFCNRLGWNNLELLIAQYQHRLQFGIERDLCDLVRLTLLNGQRARILFTAGLETVNLVARATPFTVENILINSGPFQSAKSNPKGGAFILGPTGAPLSAKEAAEAIVTEARTLVQKEFGLDFIDWDQVEDKDNSLNVGLKNASFKKRSRGSRKRNSKKRSRSTSLGNGRQSKSPRFAFAVINNNKSNHDFHSNINCNTSIAEHCKNNSNNNNNNNNNMSNHHGSRNDNKSSDDGFSNNSVSINDLCKNDKSVGRSSHSVYQIDSKLLPKIDKKRGLGRSSECADEADLPKHNVVIGISKKCDSRTSTSKNIWKGVEEECSICKCKNNCGCIGSAKSADSEYEQMKSNSRCGNGDLLNHANRAKENLSHDQTVSKDMDASHTLKVGNESSSILQNTSRNTLLQSPNEGRVKASFLFGRSNKTKKKKDYSLSSFIPVEKSQKNTATFENIKPSTSKIGSVSSNHDSQAKSVKREFKSAALSFIHTKEQEEPKFNAVSCSMDDSFDIFAAKVLSNSDLEIEKYLSPKKERGSQKVSAEAENIFLRAAAGSAEVKAEMGSKNFDGVTDNSDTESAPNGFQGMVKSTDCGSNMISDVVPSTGNVTRSIKSKDRRSAQSDDIFNMSGDTDVKESTPDFTIKKSVPKPQSLFHVKESAPKPKSMDGLGINVNESTPKQQSLTNNAKDTPMYSALNEELHLKYVLPVAGSEAGCCGSQRRISFHENLIVNEENYFNDGNSSLSSSDSSQYMILTESGLLSVSRSNIKKDINEFETAINADNSFMGSESVSDSFLDRAFDAHFCEDDALGCNEGAISVKKKVSGCSTHRRSSKLTYFDDTINLTPGTEEMMRQEVYCQPPALNVKLSVAEKETESTITAKADGTALECAAVIESNSGNIEPLSDTSKKCIELSLKDDSGNDSSLLPSRSLSIIDVASDEELFKMFLKEWSEQTVFSISLSCTKASSQPNKGGIGWKVCERSSSRRSRLQQRIAGLVVENSDLLVTGIAIAWEETCSYFINLKTTQEEALSISFPTPPISRDVPLEKRVDGVKNVFASLRERTVRCWDVKKTLNILVCCRLGLINGRLADPRVAAWILDPTAAEKNIHHLVTNHCDHLLYLLDGIGGNFGLEGLGICCRNKRSSRVRAATESVLVFCLTIAIEKALQEVDMKQSWVDTEMPIVQLLAAMELVGVGFSSLECEEQKKVMQVRLSLLEQEAFQLVGHPFSLNSPSEISKVLYRELHLPSPQEPPNIITRSRVASLRKSRLKGGPTNKEALEKIQDKHPLPKVILEWRRINNALTKFVLPLLQEKRFSSAFNMDRVFPVTYSFTATGRVTLHEPNLQNIPKDFGVQLPQLVSKTRKSKSQPLSPIMRQLSPLLDMQDSDEHRVSLRHAVVAGAGRVLLSADYSQLELRLLAHLSSDQNLLLSLKRDEDIFKSIASQINQIAVEKVTAGMRQQAKQVCYGVIYGMGEKSLGQHLNLNEDDAAVFMQKFRQKFPGIHQFIQQTIEEARENGYVLTMKHRRRYLPGLTSNISHVKSQSERQAINTRIQGSAADLVKMAMLAVHKSLQENFPQSLEVFTNPNSRSHNISGAHLILQVHDELIYEVANEDVIQVATLVKHNMENVCKLSVQFPVQLKVGPSWGSMKTLTL